MLTLSQIEQQYPESLRPFKRGMLREYLQYKVLEIIFAGAHAPKLAFLGGTALRIVHGNARFSEDLDFDNFGLGDHEFEAMAEDVRRGLEAEGLKVDIDTVSRKAYRCRIRLPEILFANALSSHAEEKILIQIDSEAQGFLYQPEKKLLNKFDVFAQISVTPTDILLSQKIYAAMNRKRAKGRDFYDIIFLSSMTKPNYAYLDLKLGIKDEAALHKKLLESIKALDFKELARDVGPFLFNPDDVRKIELFSDLVKERGIL